MAYVSRTKRLYFSVFLTTALIVAGIALFVIYVMPKHAMLTFKDVELEAVQVEKGDVMPELPIPTLYGHNFNGWYYSREYNENQKVHEGIDVVEYDLDLYPHFTPASYTIQFNSNGGTGTGTSYVDQVFDTNFVFPTMDQAGVANADKVLVGWSLNEDGTGTIYKAGDIQKVSGENVTFYAVWDFPKTTVHFVVGAGVGYKPAYTAYSGSLLPAEEQEAPAGGKTGHTFGGWYTTEECIGTAIDFSTWTLQGENVSIYAKWNPEIYTIRFIVNGELYTTKEVAFGTKLERPEDPVVSGYVFVSWCLDESGLGTYNFDSLATQNYNGLKLFAKLSEAEVVDQTTPVEAFEVEDYDDGVIILGITNDYKGYKSLNIPSQINGKNVIAIDDGVRGLNELVEVTIPSTIQEIGVQAFTSCPKLAEFKLSSTSDYFAVENDVLYSADKKELLRYPAAKTGYAFETGETVTTIADYAFSDVNKLEKLTITKGSVGSSVFSNAVSLTELVFGIDVAAISDSTFYNNKTINAVTSNSAIVVVQDGAIYNSDITVLYRVFNTTPNFEYVAPATLTSINAQAFFYLSNLKSATFAGQNCVNVMNNSFFGCVNLTTLTFGADNFVSVGTNIINNCQNIETIYLNKVDSNSLYTRLKSGSNPFSDDVLTQLP